MNTLAELKPNQVGTVEAIDGEDAISVRLMEMGIIEGEQIKLVGFAPMGDPIEFSLRGYRLSLRKVEAQRVRISFA